MKDREGDENAVLENCNKLIALEPACACWHLERGAILLKIINRAGPEGCQLIFVDDQDKALADLDKAIEKCRDSYWKMEAFFERANDCRRKGNNSESSPRKVLKDISGNFPLNREGSENDDP